MQKAADYLNVDYRSVLRHLDTGLVTRKLGQLVLIFSVELTEQVKKDLLSSSKALASLGETPRNEKTPL